MSNYTTAPAPERPILPGEDAAAWDAFRAAIVADLDPGSALEAELAERVAVQLWRLRRVARYEAEMPLERVLRYEAHLSKQLNQALQLLRQFKGERRAKEQPVARAGSVSDGPAAPSLTLPARQEAGEPPALRPEFVRRCEALLADRIAADFLTAEKIGRSPPAPGTTLPESRGK
jgi:hypothetical protein